MTNFPPDGVNPQNPARNMDGTPRYNVSYSVGVGFATLETAEVSRIRRQAADLLAIRASEVLGLDMTQIVVRDILPKTDLGYTNEIWASASLTANTYTPLFTQKTLLSTQLVCFWGVIDLSPSPSLTGVSFSKGTAQTMVLAQIEAALGWTQYPFALIRPTVLYNPSDPVLIQGYVNATGVQEVVLLGFEAEQIGVNVAPNQIALQMGM